MTELKVCVEASKMEHWRYSFCIFCIFARVSSISTQGQQQPEAKYFWHIEFRKSLNLYQGRGGVANVIF